VASLKTLDRPGLLGDRVYVTLREHLCSGWVPSGQPLQEVALAAQLGVSRTPVREALARLASEGLLGSDGRSFIMPSLSEADIDDIYELRLLLEPEAIRQVAKRIRGRAQIAPFREQIAAMVDANTKNDVAAFMEANYRFRAAWLEIVPNRRLLRAIELYADHVRYLRALTLGDHEVRTVVLNGLKRIAAAVSAADGAGASAAMREHLLEAKRILRSSLTPISK
jgi:DNA-binding GntR family transcriptional regulator